MKKSISLFGPATRAAAALGACLLASGCLLAGAGLLVSAGPAGAFTPAEKASGESAPLNLGASPSGSHAGSGGPSLVRTIVGLAIVIAVIWGLSWILRQVKSGRPGRHDRLPSAGLGSVAAVTLGSGRSVHLVRAGSDYLVVGSSEQGVVPIQRYSAAQAHEIGLLGTERRIAGLGGEAGGLGGEERERPDPMNASEPGPATNLIDRLRELTVRR